MSSPACAYVGLGSNLDDPVQQVRRALHALDALPRTRLLRHSRLYRTPPWGITAQPAFVNAVAELSSELTPCDLLAAMLAVECAQGRRRDDLQWGPRTIDLDLLSYGQLQLTEPGLVLPHPHIGARAFVLVPLAELDASLLIPGLGVVRDLLDRIDIADCVPIDD